LDAWLADASLSAESCGVPEDGGYVVDGVEVPGGDVHNQFAGLVVGQRQAAPVEAVEGDERGEREPLVAVDQCMVAGQ
jgi:hypothetical protein